MIFTVDTERETLTIDGVAISLALLAMLAQPDPDKHYSLVRHGTMVTAKVHHGCIQSEDKP
jgi:hypothetical protein